MKSGTSNSHGVGRRFSHATLSQLNKKYFAEVFNYAKEYKKFIKRGEGLLLSGPPGIGKTFAIVALMKHIKEQEGGRFDYYIVTAPRLFELYATAATANEVDTHRGVAWNRLFEGVDGMVINDLGKEERIRDWQQEAAAYKLGRLLRSRHEDQLPIFITTNFPIVPLRNNAGVTFETAYGGSIWSLVKDMTCGRYQVNAPDLREKKASKERGDGEEEE